ncbi:MAG: preprotein translocase subunit SecE [Clostridia bacterium]|nr:preprotein translocase subunit SecE [Clostridia bacterium]
MAQQQKAKRPNIFVRFGKFLAKAWSELRKVTWPTFPTVAKNLGIVLVVTLFFTLLMLGADQLFSWIMVLLGNIM